MALLHTTLHLPKNEIIGFGFNYAVIDKETFRPYSNGASVDIVFNGLDLPVFLCQDQGSEIAKVELNKRDDFGTIFIDVKTNAAYRQKGYGSTVVSAATAWLLNQRFIPRYGAEATNIGSINPAKKLGYMFCSRYIVV